MPKTKEIAYELRLINTDAATGYFTCVPVPEPGLAAAMASLRQRPFDDFLRRYLLSALGRLDDAQLANLAKQTFQLGDMVILALLHELAILADKPSPIQDPALMEQLCKASSLIYLRVQTLPERQAHAQWAQLFKVNIYQHRLLPSPDQAQLPLLFVGDTLRDSKRGADILDLSTAAGPKPADSDRKVPEETIERALERLRPLDIFEDSETRHQSSLSPIAYLRKWRMQISVRSGRNHYSLSGIQTSYGKGLSPEAARASCLMEVVERVSSFASIDGTRLPDYKKDCELITGSYQELCGKGLPAVDPNRMVLEVPYTNEKLHWMAAEDVNGAARLIPVQAVFLFANLDEVSLLSNLGSTGLASGNTMEEAKVAGLLEVIERDADAVVPFDTTSCFDLYTENPHLMPLFEAYQAQGIHIRFQEVTTEFGIPCYRCFVVDAGGQIIRGTGANLDGRRAVMSALTETTFPFPAGPASAPGLSGLPRRRFEDLPNFDTNSSRNNLALIETLLTSRGYSPVYVDLTRKDVDIPVVKAVVPGLDWLAEFDRFAGINPRLFANYLKLGNRKP